MSRTWLRRAIIIVTASVVFPVTFSFTAHAAVGASASRAADPGADPLAAAMVQTADLPAGFRPYAPATGQMNAQRAQLLHFNLDALNLHEGWARTWLSPPPPDEVVELAIDAGTRDSAQAAAAAAAANLTRQGAARQPIAGPVRFAAFSGRLQLNGVRSAPVQPGHALAPG